MQDFVRFWCIPNGVVRFILLRYLHMLHRRWRRIWLRVFRLDQNRNKVLESFWPVLLWNINFRYANQSDLSIVSLKYLDSRIHHDVFNVIVQFLGKCGVIYYRPIWVFLISKNDLKKEQSPRFPEKCSQNMETCISQFKCSLSKRDAEGGSWENNYIVVHHDKHSSHSC